jgi:hypothetical protein
MQPSRTNATTPTTAPIIADDEAVELDAPAAVDAMFGGCVGTTVVLTGAAVFSPAGCEAVVGGSAVGDAVVETVGVAAAGALVTRTDGWIDLKVGNVVGPTEGAAVGDRVGTAEGAAVGDRVGTDVGLHVLQSQRDEPLTYAALPHGHDRNVSVPPN